MIVKIGNKKEDANNILFTSDQHWNHANMIKFCNRPFKDIQEMDERLIENWNKVVHNDDIVFHLGDFAFGGKEVFRSVRECLNGRIVLIKGNHDLIQNVQNDGFLESLFDYVSLELVIQIDGWDFILNHCPLLCYGGTYRKDKPVINLFGHVHTLRNDNKGLDYPRLQNLFPTQYDVGVDYNGFTPLTYDELMKILKYQIDNNANMLK